MRRTPLAHTGSQQTPLGAWPRSGASAGSLSSVGPRQKRRRRACGPGPQQWPTSAFATPVTAATAAASQVPGAGQVSPSIFPGGLGTPLSAARSPSLAPLVLAEVIASPESVEGSPAAAAPVASHRRRRSAMPPSLPALDENSPKRAAKGNRLPRLSPEPASRLLMDAVGEIEGNEAVSPDQGTEAVPALECQESVSDVGLMVYKGNGHTECQK